MNHPSSPPWKDIPADILLELLRYLKRCDQWKIAGVCVSWRYVALEAFGKRVRDVREVLSRICVLDDDRTAFERLPRRKDWLGFQPFRYNIVRLFIHCDLVTESMMNDLQRMPYDSRPLLPLLVELALVHPGDRDELYHLGLPLILCPTIRKLALYDIPPSSSFKCKRNYRLAGFFDDVIACSMNLKYLTLTLAEAPTQREATALNTILRKFINELRDLETAVFSTGLLTHHIIHALSQLPNLRIVHAASSHPDSWEQLAPFSAAPSPDFYRCLELDEGSWPKLEFFTAIMTLPLVAYLLEQAHFPSSKLNNLTVLTIGSYEDDNGTIRRFASVDDVTAFLLALSLKCAQLRGLHIELNSPYASAGEPQNEDHLLTVAHLAPLRELKQLEKFYLHDKRGVNLTENGLLYLMEPLTSMEILYICPYPHLTLPPATAVDENEEEVVQPPMQPTLPLSQFTMNTLHRLLMALPRLKELAIFLDVSNGQSAVVQDDTSHNDCASLNVLHLGHSVPPPPSLPTDAFKRYLSREGKLVVGTQHHHRWGGHDPDIILYFDQWLKGWNRFIVRPEASYEATMPVHEGSLFS